ncbi:MAG TPA: glutamine--fructose-6-phosphate transaminase (isomerizing) [Terriglobales bacterium]|nr:glutamine--fructose-6-phosphate transaminase (isomerizing) [Terriglobales bacterium]
MSERAGFPHHMLKEIHEQPRGVRETVVPRLTSAHERVVFPGLGIEESEFRALRRIQIVGSGTSRHAGLAGKYMIEQLARLPVEVDHASEFAYRDPIVGGNELVVAITQSGETVDTLNALREASARGGRTIGICNVIDSTIAREADGALYTYAGPEISIASTKAFTAQLAVLYLLALYLGEHCGNLSGEALRQRIAALLDVPAAIDSALQTAGQCRQLAEEYCGVRDFLYLGRGVHYPVALDGALKLKEVSYIHAEGHPAGEMKHGPNALIDEDLPVVILATRDDASAGSRTRYEKTLSNLKEVKARSGQVIAVAVEGDDEIAESADHVIFVPPAPELLLPMLEIVPLQLLAYYVAVRRGLDVDKPRNLAKAVLVE